MILASKDKALIQDYLEVIKEKETILWEGNMEHLIKPGDFNANLDGFLTYGIFLTFLSVACFDLPLACLILIIGIIGQKFLRAVLLTRQQYKEDKVKHTQYLITNNGIIFILWRKRKFHIHNIPYSNIQRIIVNGRKKTLGSIFIIPREPVGFKTYNYKNNKPSPYISLINISNPGEVETILQKHL